MKIQLGTGVIIKNENKKFIIDGKKPSDEYIGIVSHAHADHTPSDPSGSYICSDLTYDLSNERGRGFERSKSVENVELVPSGHIVGSRSILITMDGKNILCTSDYNTSDTEITSGIDLDYLSSIDISDLIIESTYGDPKYNRPRRKEVEDGIVEWLKNSDKLTVCKGYSLGRAQEIEYLARRSGYSNIYVNKATKNVNQVLNRHNTKYKFSENVVEDLDGLSDNDILITSSKSDLQELENRARTSIFTGWALDGRYSERYMYDNAFPISDHADFNGLMNTIESISPSKVHTIHGFKDNLAKKVYSRLGIEARALKRNQYSLNKFTDT
jgi:putative mRNA 3-end processing factor